MGSYTKLIYIIFNKQNIIYQIYILNTTCSDDSSPNAAHKCALPMFTEPPAFL